jgi:hypothetical protein
MDQKILEIQVKGLLGKMSKLEEAERGSVTCKQLVCGFIFCIIFNIFFNIVMLGMEGKLSGNNKDALTSKSEQHIYEEMERLYPGFDVSGSTNGSEIPILEDIENTAPVNL